ncbi:MAG TPA: hypothetical protein VEG33_17690 [Streptosporangiaceae bacterium]|nr:hypothetical protein [Streptosporangiaceae bacterium]
MSYKHIVGGRTYTGVAAYIRLIFSSVGLIVAAYILVGVFYNTAPPHLPTFAFSAAALHSWVQYFISVLFWPLSFWDSPFTVAQWPAGSTP